MHICCRGNGSRAAAVKIQFTPEHIVIYHQAAETPVSESRVLPSGGVGTALNLGPWPLRKLRGQ